METGKNMRGIQKAGSFALIIALAVAILIVIQPASAIFTPAVPQFTVKIVNHTYDEPTTYSVNQFTGETIAHGGKHYEWKTLDITITNQPVNQDGENSLRYNIRYKGQYTDQWTENTGEGAYYPQNTSSSTTLFSYYLEGDWPGFPGATSAFASLPNGTKVSFQVMALWGHDEYNFFTGFRSYDFIAISGSNSNLQTITMGSGEVTVTEASSSFSTSPPTPVPTATAKPTPNTTAQPEQPSVTPTQNPPTTSNQPNAHSDVVFGLDWGQIAIVLLIVVAVLAAALIFTVTRKAKMNTGGIG